MSKQKRKLRKQKNREKKVKDKLLYNKASVRWDANKEKEEYKRAWKNREKIEPIVKPKENENDN